MYLELFLLSDAEKNFAKKLAPVFEGPYMIVKFGNYKVNVCLKHKENGVLKWAHIEQLKLE